MLDFLNYNLRNYIPDKNNNIKYYQTKEEKMQQLASRLGIQKYGKGKRKRNKKKRKKG